MSLLKFNFQPPLQPMAHGTTHSHDNQTVRHTIVVGKALFWTQFLPPKVNTTLYASCVIRPGEDTLSKRGEIILAQRTHNVAHRGGVIKASQCHLKGKNPIIDKTSSYRCTIGSFHTYLLNTSEMLYWLISTGKKIIIIL